MRQGGKYCLSLWKDKVPYFSRKNCFLLKGAQAFEVDEQGQNVYQNYILLGTLRTRTVIAKRSDVKSFREGSNVFLILVINFLDNI